MKWTKLQLFSYVIVNGGYIGLIISGLVLQLSEWYNALTVVTIVTALSSALNLLPGNWEVVARLHKLKYLKYIEAVYDVAVMTTFLVYQEYALWLIYVSHVSSIHLALFLHRRKCAAE